MSILSAENLSKRFKFRQVVKGISLEIKSGEVVGLLGPNGAGKTTAFYMIVGLIPADRGRIMLDGRDLTPLAMHQRARIGLGYLPQEASVFRKLTVEKNIMAILQTRAELDRAERERLLEELLDELHIHHVRNSLGISLSGGDFTTNLGRLSGGWQFSPWAALTGNIQYDDGSELIGLFARFRWIIRPGNDFFLVYTHNWDNLGDRLQDLHFSTRSRGATTKINYTHRF